MGGLESK